jgi:hypothetical protein
MLTMYIACALLIILIEIDKTSSNLERPEELHG